MECDKPDISILMPAKNSGMFIRKTLDSIIAQTDQDWELVIANDGSTDDTAEIIRDYAAGDSRIRLYDNECGCGIIPALRTALSKSRGEFITRMDSDDLMAPEKLDKLQRLLSGLGPGHVATGMVECFSDEGLAEGYLKYERWLNGVINSGDPYSEIYRECVIQSSCWMTYRDDLIKCGAFEPRIYPEDYDLCFRFRYGYGSGKGLKPVVVPEILHYWRDHPGRVSRNNPVYADQQFFDLKLRYFFEYERDIGRDLVIWGTGPKGKKLVRKILDGYTNLIRWTGNNPKKIDELIYGIRIENESSLELDGQVQIIIAVSGPDDLKDMENQLNLSRSVKNRDHFFFC